MFCLGKAISWDNSGSTGDISYHCPGMAGFCLGEGGEERKIRTVPDFYLKENQDKPNASVRSLSNSSWMAGLMWPKRLKISAFERVGSLFILNTDSFLSPIEAKSG